jgi:hypothetical protein
MQALAESTSLATIASYVSQRTFHLPPPDKAVGEHGNRIGINDWHNVSSASMKAAAFGFSEAKVGGHSARSMMFQEMCILIRALPVVVITSDFARAIIDENVLEKPTQSSRKSSLRHLIELYGLDTSKALFRVLWQLGHADLDSLPQLCLVCAYARDPQLRRSFELLRSIGSDEVLERASMERHLESGFPERFSPAMKKSMAQNVNTTWTFGGHLTGKAKKIRRLPEPRPSSAAYAMLVGYLTGLRGELLIDSAYADLVASNRSQLLAALSLASAKGLLSLKIAAGIVEFDFSTLLTSAELELLHESH